AKTILISINLTNCAFKPIRFLKPYRFVKNSLLLGNEGVLLRRIQNLLYRARGSKQRNNSVCCFYLMQLLAVSHIFEDRKLGPGNVQTATSDN
ncbi:MAG: hypothetical protein ACTHMD_07610, partial [Flavisolibacter sp.]